MSLQEAADASPLRMQEDDIKPSITCGPGGKQNAPDYSQALQKVHMEGPRRPILLEW